MKRPRPSLPFAIAALAAATAAAALAQSSSSEQQLQKEVNELKGEVKALRGELDEIKTTLRELTSRQNPVLDLTGAQAMGDAKAKVVLIEFSDYQCPYCMDYFSHTYRKLIDEFVNTGKVRYVARDFPSEGIHPNALRAAEAARCAIEQGKFWPMHDGLFDNQRNLATTGPSDAAKAAGLDMPAFQKCLDSGKYTAPIRKDVDDEQKLGVKGTPAFYFGTPDPANPSKVKLVTALIGAQPLEQFEKVIAMMLTR